MPENEFAPVTPGEMLKEEFLAEYGLSQNQLAKAVGISPNRIAEIGNPIDILVNPQADQAEMERATAALGLDKPLWLQYLIFLGNAFRGDLGRSFVFNQPALQLIMERLPATLELAIAASVLAIIIGIPSGLYAGLRPHSLAGKAITAGSILGFSLPTFWVGLVLIMVFAVQLGWLPSTGRGATVRVLGIETSLLTLDR